MRPHVEERRGVPGHRVGVRKRRLVIPVFYVNLELLSYRSGGQTIKRDPHAVQVVVSP